MTPSAKISTARLWASRHWPYFTQALLSLIPKEVPNGTFAAMAPQGTVAVTDRLMMLYEPQAIDRWSVEELGSALIHETMHVLRRHAGRCGSRNRQLWNIAGDLEINDDLQGTVFVLPEGSMYPKAFGFPDGRIAEEYYNLLTAQDPPPQPKHKCGGCSGNPHEGEDEAKGTGDGDEDGEPEQGRSPAEVEAVIRQTAQAVQEAKNRGKLPGGLSRWADGALAPPKVPWERRIVMAARRSATVKAGAVEHRYRRPSRRQAGIGYGPGCPVLPSYVAPVPNVVIAQDTSGSMGQAEMEAGLAEVNGALKALGGDITFMSCDAAVHTLGKVRTVQQAKTMLKGGGGTDFCPVFDKIAEDGIPCDILVFVTDGYGSAPAHAPKKYKTIWLITPGGKVPAAWGEAIYV